MSSLFAFGNLKLPTTTAIFNMGPASNGKPGAAFRMQCPEFHKGTCQLGDAASECYSVKAERQYPNVRTFRNRQRRFWQSCTAHTFVAAFERERRRTTTHLRFNESGGIATVADVRKVEAIARLLPDLAVYFYTSRHDLWDAGAFDTMPDNVTVNGSGFMAHNSFTVSRDIPAGAVVCPMDCRVCDRCSKRENQNIFVEYH